MYYSTNLLTRKMYKAVTLLSFKGLTLSSSPSLAVMDGSYGGQEMSLSSVMHRLEQGEKGNTQVEPNGGNL